MAAAPKSLQNAMAAHRLPPHSAAVDLDFFTSPALLFCTLLLPFSLFVPKSSKWDDIVEARSPALLLPSTLPDMSPLLPCPSYKETPRGPTAPLNPS